MIMRLDGKGGSIRCVMNGLLCLAAGNEMYLDGYRKAKKARHANNGALAGRDGKTLLFYSLLGSYLQKRL